MEAGGYSGPMVDGEVIAADPPHRLVQTWRMLMDPATKAEGFTRLSYDIEPVGGGCRLSVTHELSGAPGLAAMVAGSQADPSTGGGGWTWVLSDLKSLLETGSTLAG